MYLADSVRNAMVDAATALLDAGAGPGKIEVRTGAAPATPAGADTGTLLATITLQDPSSGSASGGVDTILDPAQISPVANGLAGHARFKDSNNVVRWDATVGTIAGGTGDLRFSTLTFDTGVPVDMAAITFTQPASP